jgi:transcriptional regulator with XRE-family HTH domain
MTTRVAESSRIGRRADAGPPEHESPGIGELLRRARQGRGLTLEQIAHETRIPRRHLEALEHDNFAVLPAGFYRRAQILAFARAVNLDQRIALAELERAEAVPETPRNQGRGFPVQRVLIVIGVVVAAAVFGRAGGGREPALHDDAHVRSVIDSPQHSVPPVRDTPPSTMVEISRAVQLDQVAPLLAPSDRALAEGNHPTEARALAASNGDLAVTTEQTEARVSGDSVTELVVTTQPAGARVTVNGIGWGLAPVTIRHLPAGDKRIRVSKEGYTTEERTVRLAEGHPRMLDIRLRAAQPGE